MVVYCFFLSSIQVQTRKYFCTSHYQKIKQSNITICDCNIMLQTSSCHRKNEKVLLQSSTTKPLTFQLSAIKSFTFNLSTNLEWFNPVTRFKLQKSFTSGAPFTLQLLMLGSTRIGPEHKHILKID